MKILPHAIAALVLAALLGFGAFFLGLVTPHSEHGVPTEICVNSAASPQRCVE